MDIRPEKNDGPKTLPYFGRDLGPPQPKRESIRPLLVVLLILSTPVILLALLVLTWMIFGYDG
jgi:hypothetical protein